MGWLCCSTPEEQQPIGRQESGRPPKQASLVDSASSCNHHSLKSTTDHKQMPRQQEWVQQWLVPEVLGPRGKYEELLLLQDTVDGKVVLARDWKTKERMGQVVVRLMRHGSPRISEREILNHRLCSHHPHIIKFKGAHATTTHLAIVTEYADLGTLADYLSTKRQSSGFQGDVESKIRPLFQQLILALAFCHAKGVSNRSITLETILLGRPPAGGSRHPILKLWDFELSKDSRMDSACKTACGTAEYLAPEVLLYTEYDGAKSDMWSVGVVLFVMLTGTYPFREDEDQDLAPAAALQNMFHRILSARCAVPRTLSRPCRHLLRHLICVEVDRRLDIAAVLQHPWFMHGLSDEVVEANQRLADAPLETLTLTSPQTEQEVLAVVHAAMHPMPSP